MVGTQQRAAMPQGDKSSYTDKQKRQAAHIREYVITDKGVVVIHPRTTEYEGLITGIPKRTGPRPAQKQEAAPEPKATKKLPVGTKPVPSQKKKSGASRKFRK